MKRIILFNIILCFAIISFLYGAGETSFNFLKISQGARQSGMGEAFTGVADDVNAVYWNPSGLAQLTRQQVCLLHSVWLIDVNYEYLAYAIPIKGIGAFGIYGTFLAGQLDEITYENPVNGQYIIDSNAVAKASDINVTLAYAKKMSDFVGNNSTFSDLYAGLNVNITMENIYEDTGNGFGTNIGLLYYPKYENYSFGLMVLNAGIASERPTLPFAIKFGFGYKFSYNNILMPFTDQGYYKFLDNDSVLAIDMIYYPVEQLVKVNFGTEKYWVLNKYHSLAARLGYKFGSDLGLLAGLTLGAGYRMTINENFQFDFDYAFVPYGDLGEAHRISITGKMFGTAETNYVENKQEALKYYKEGYELLYNKKYAEAITKFSESLKRYRNYSQAYMGMGACFLRLGKKETAKEVYELALQNDPNNQKLKEFIENTNWNVK
jgi:tetratricopeptide (TPR) repeat protein